MALASEPSVTITMAARNEALNIETKLKSILKLDYPKDKIEVIVGSDGSEDDTVKIVNMYKKYNFKALNLKRMGKAMVNNSMVEKATGEIIIDTSSSGYFNPCFVKKIVSHFSNPHVGCVTGESYFSNTGESVVGKFEGLYFQYEWIIRSMESKLGLLCVGNGGVLAWRKSLYKPIDCSSDVDNMVPLMVVEEGYKVVHEKGACTLGESASTNRGGQLKGRVRQVTRSQQDIFRVPKLLNPFTHPRTAWILWSHRLLRWWTPFFAILIFFMNLIILQNPFYFLTFCAQLLFYILGLVGVAFPKLFNQYRFISIPTTIINIAACFIVGTVNAFKGKKIVTW